MTCETVRKLVEMVNRALDILDKLEDSALDKEPNAVNAKTAAQY